MNEYTEYNALVNDSGVKIYSRSHGRTGARLYKRVSDASKERVRRCMEPDGFLRKNKPEKPCPPEFEYD